jgi:phytoene synthase
VTAAETNVAPAARASGSSFYAGMRILPPAQREAMFAIYGFCRQVDDIADSDLPRPQRLAQLEEWRADIDALCAGRPGARTANLAPAVRAFKLERSDFLAVIDGMKMDAAADIRAPSLATLDLYCDRVASAVGRLSVNVFGMRREEGVKLAHHLGRALQLTNILRDLDEDAGLGRLYLPREALQRAGIASDDPQAVLASPALAVACGEVAALARGNFVAADAVMRGSPRRTVRAPRIMGEVYRLLLDGMEARGFAAPRVRISVPRWRLLWILLRHAIP